MPSPDTRPQSGEPAAKLAVLIDADNAQAAVIEPILAEIARFGEATVRRIYGDFTSSRSAAWKGVLQKHAIKPVQQFAYTTGKNATDSTLIIDAMDLLYTRKFDGFCLITSDSDFTGLATRLREEGLTVLGFGERKTPDAFRNACHKFVLTEVLRPSSAARSKPPAAPSRPEHPVPAPAAKADVAAKPKPQQPPQPAPKAVAPAYAAPSPAPAAPAPRPPDALAIPGDFLLDALDQSCDDDGWADLASFGSYLNKLQPDFDPRVYGYRKLSDMVRARADLFVTEERQVPGQSKTRMFIRAK